MSRTDAEPDAVEAVKHLSLLESTLLKHRTLTIFGEINKDVAQRTAEKLLAVAFESDDPITLFICSPGGHMESGDTIFDMIRFVKPVVRTVGTGWVGSAATHIYLAAEREHRYALPNTRFLIHQPAGGFGGDATERRSSPESPLQARFDAPTGCALRRALPSSTTTRNRTSEQAYCFRSAASCFDSTVASFSRVSAETSCPVLRHASR
jgi:ATP-dependent Clp endopeptidase proteolytic subunit ClpP